jgi:hypothetical protein
MPDRSSNRLCAAASAQNRSNLLRRDGAAGHDLFESIAILW